MGALIPDTGLRGLQRVVWVDAKYKAHLSLLARHGWHGLTDAVRDAHRADLHQALAYTALSRSEVSLAPRRRTSSALVLTGGCVLGLIAALRGVS